MEKDLMTSRKTRMHRRAFLAALAAVPGAWLLSPSEARADNNPFYTDFVNAARKVGVPTSWATNHGLCQIVVHESSWNPRARNPSSSAFGLFQFLSSTWRAYLPEVPYGTVNAYWQAVGGYRYIRARYGNPDNAWAFWQAHHWY
jgi:SLT domain-containing protein